MGVMQSTAQASVNNDDKDSNSKPAGSATPSPSSPSVDEKGSANKQPATAGGNVAAQDGKADEDDDDDKQPADSTVKWVDDNASPSCMQCNAAFTVFNRRHHCRACGKLVCNACSSVRWQLAGWAKPDRICPACAEKNGVPANVRKAYGEKKKAGEKREKQKEKEKDDEEEDEEEEEGEGEEDQEEAADVDDVVIDGVLGGVKFKGGKDEEVAAGDGAAGEKKKKKKKSRRHRHSKSKRSMSPRNKSAAMGQKGEKEKEKEKEHEKEHEQAEAKSPAVSSSPPKVHRVARRTLRRAGGDKKAEEEEGEGRAEGEGVAKEQADKKGADLSLSPALSPASSASAHARPSTVTKLSPAEVFNKLSGFGSLLLVDTRTREQYMSAHLPGAINIPVRSGQSTIADLVGQSTLADKTMFARRKLMNVIVYGYGDSYGQQGKTEEKKQEKKVSEEKKEEKEAQDSNKKEEGAKHEKKASEAPELSTSAPKRVSPRARMNKFRTFHSGISPSKLLAGQTGQSEKKHRMAQSEGAEKARARFKAEGGRKEKKGEKEKKEEEGSVAVRERSESETTSAKEGGAEHVSKPRTITVTSTTSQRSVSQRGGDISTQSQADDSLSSAPPSPSASSTRASPSRCSSVSLSPPPASAAASAQQQQPASSAADAAKNQNGPRDSDVIFANMLAEEHACRSVSLMTEGFDSFATQFGFALCSFSDAEKRTGRHTHVKTVPWYPTVVCERVLLGNHVDAKDKAKLVNMNVTHVLNVTQDLPNLFPETFTYLQCPLEDKETENLLSHLEQCYKFIESATQAQGTGRIMVHCQEGISRSPSMVIAWLMTTKHMTLKQAFDYLKARRPQVFPNPGFWQQLSEIEKRLFNGQSTLLQCIDMKIIEEERQAKAKLNASKDAHAQYVDHKKEKKDKKEEEKEKKEREKELEAATEPEIAAEGVTKICIIQ